MSEGCFKIGTFKKIPPKPTWRLSAFRLSIWSMNIAFGSHTVTFSSFAYLSATLLHSSISSIRSLQSVVFS